MSEDVNGPTRLRVVGWRVQPLVMLDDGDSLEEIAVDPVTIRTADWDEFKSGGDAQAIQGLTERVLAPADVQP